MLIFNSVNSGWIEYASWEYLGSEQIMQDQLINPDLLGILTLNLQGRVYAYQDVPYFVYKELIDSGSAGTYFNFNIKDVYQFYHS